MKRIKIVQIGALHDHSGFIFSSLKKQSDIFDVVGYAIPEGEGMVDAHVYDGYERMSVEEALSVPGLEAVTIETGELNLTKYAQLSADHGLAVHMDKPGGASLSEFEHLIETVKKNGTVFHTGYMYRYNPAVIKLQEDIKAGKLGQILSVEAQMNCYHHPEKRKWLATIPGGEMFFLGCHMVDLAYSVLGEPERIVPFNTRTGSNGVACIDYGMAVLQYPHAVALVKSFDVEDGGFMRRQLVVNGTKGSVQLLPLEVYGEEPGTFYTTVREVLEDYSWTANGRTYNTEPYDRYDSMMRGFYRCAIGEWKNPYDYDYELNLYRLFQKCCADRSEANE